MQTRKYLTIGQLAALLGRHPDILKKYERRGVIPRPRRDPINGYRVWSLVEVEEICSRLRGRWEIARRMVA